VYKAALSSSAKIARILTFLRQIELLLSKIIAAYFILTFSIFYADCPLREQI